MKPRSEKKVLRFISKIKNRNPKKMSFVLAKIFKESRHDPV